MLESRSKAQKTRA